MARDLIIPLSDSLPMAATKRRMSRLVAVSRRVVIALGVLLGILCALFACLAGNASNVLLNHVRDAYILYRVTHERDALRASLQNIENEVIALRVERSKDRILEDELHTNLKALHEVVSLAGSLGLIEKKAGLSHGKTASNSRDVKSSELQELARVLSGQEVVKKREALPEDVERLRSINKGLGGAEVECKRDKSGQVKCISDASKQDVALASSAAELLKLPTDVPSTSSSASERDPRIEAINRIASVTKALRVMPIGSPVEGEFTSGFGHRRSPFSRRSSFHEGIDISLPHGHNVLSTADGVVANVAYDRTYGWMVDVEHAPDLVTRYAHLSRALVREGDQVKRGDLVALSGSTGRSTGPHLHYEVRFKDVARDPKPFLALASKLRSFS